MLSSLNVQNCRIGDDALVDIFSRCRYLKEVVISSTLASDASLEALAKHSSILEELYAASLSERVTATPLVELAMHCKKPQNSRCGFVWYQRRDG